jgi:hypothetical protein
MPEEEKEEIKICEFDEHIKCQDKLKEKGCEFCMQVQTRAFLSAMHQNIMALVNINSPKKVVNLGEIGKRKLFGRI